MERRITVAAKFASGSGGTQPVAASQAFRINTLHGPTRQILHVSPPLERHAIFPPAPGPEMKREVAGILRRVSCGVKRKDTISSGRVADGTGAPLTTGGSAPPSAVRSARGTASSRKEARSLHPRKVCTQSGLLRVTQQENCLAERRFSDANWVGTRTARRSFLCHPHI